MNPHRSKPTPNITLAARTPLYRIVWAILFRNLNERIRVRYERIYNNIFKNAERMRRIQREKELNARGISCYVITDHAVCGARINKD